MDDGGGGDEAPLSLSQLIYPNSSPKKVAKSTTKKKKRKFLLEENLIDNFYGLVSPKLEDGTPGAAQTAATANTPATATRKRLRTRRKAGQRGPGEDWKLETRAQAEERERKRAGNQQIDATQGRWKARKLDVRQEVDVGGVYENLVRKYWRPKDYDDADNNGKQKSYWDQGRTVPAKAIGIPLPHQIKLLKKKLPPDTEPPKYKFPQRQVVTVYPPRTLQRQPAVNLPIAGVYFHQGTLARLAAQQLISGCSTAERQEQQQLEDRLLKNIFKINHNSRFDALVTEVGEQGQNAQVFREHIWTDRTKAANALLATSGHKSERRTTNRLSTRAREGRTRAQVLGKLNGGSIREYPPEYEVEEDTVVARLDYGDNGEETRGNKLYQFIKGSDPPIPQLPLHEGNIEFGAKDPNGQAVRVARIEPPTADLTMSTLLGRLAAAKRDDKQDLVVENHDRVTSFLRLLRTENDTFNQGLINRLKAGKFNTQAVSQYLTLMQYCQYTANSDVSGLTKKVKNKVEEDESDVDDDIEAKPINHRAEDMSLVLEHSTNKIGLKGAFPRLPFICALSHVARELPEEVVELFARHDDTPFKIVRRTLEFLERKAMFVDHESKLIQGRNILPAHLEYVLHEAGEIIENKCVAVSLEIDYQAWLTALRFGCLLLCSGIKIGGAAFPHRSFKSRKVNVDALFSQESQVDMLAHEVRISLPKYEESRLDAVENFRSFLKAADRCAEGRKSELIVSALEWSQAIAQMIGPGKKGRIEVDARWEEVCLLHTRHALQAVPLNASQLKKLRDVDGIDRNATLNRLADNLENMPSNILYWRELVQEVGALGCKQEHACECEECKCLLEGINADHSERQGPHWWGRHRVSWWKAHLVRTSKDYKHIPMTRTKLSQDLSTRLAKGDLPGVFYGPATSDAQELDTDYSWLDRTLKSLKKRLDAPDGRKVKVPSREERDRSVDNLLPAPFAEKYDADAAICGALIESMDNKGLEIHCYKVILLGYLYGANHASVADGVWFLACEYGHESKKATPHQKRNAWRSLVWLASQGLNFPRIFKNHIALAKSGTESESNAAKRSIAPLKESMDIDLHETSKKRSKRWTSEAKKVLILAAQQYGTSHAKIRDNVPFFENWTRVQIQCFYRSLVQEGDISKS